MKALANERGVIAATAMDQRGNLQKALSTFRGVDVHEITPAMMSEFKVAVSRILTPYASAILLDPEFGLEAGRARAPNAGLLLAYELSGYDNTRPGSLPDLLPHVSVRRLVDWGADAVKILIYYSPFDDASVNDFKYAFMERIGAECETYEIPFFLEIVGYDPKGGDEKSLEYARHKPEIVKKSMEVFSRTEFRVDVLKVEVPINAEFVEGSAVYKGQKAYTRDEARKHFREAAAMATRPFIYLSRRREYRPVYRVAGHRQRGRRGLLRRTLRARHLEGWHSGVRQTRAQSAGRMAATRRRAQHRRRQRAAGIRVPVVHKARNLRDRLISLWGSTRARGRPSPCRRPAVRA